MKFGFGIVGCGMISQFHARAIAELRGAMLVGCCDTVAASAERFAAANHCTAYHSLAAMLANAEVSVVTIATPSGAHMEPAVAAARAGKHVIVEKPLEVTLGKCDRIIRECEKHRVQLATVFPSRFHDSSVKLKRAIDAGRFGRLTVGDAYVKWYRTQEYYDSGAWRGTWALDGGGALMNQAIHSVDLLAWLMGPVVEVSAFSATLAHERIEVEDVVVASLRFASGALGTIEASTAAYPGSLKRIEISGMQGTAIIEEEDIKVWEFEKKNRKDEEILARLMGKTHTGGGAADPSAIGHHGHRMQFEDVLKAIKKGGKPLIDGPEGRKSIEIILAIYKSAEIGKAVGLPLSGDPTLAARKRRKEGMGR
jgi:predicted dehydrogenase